MRACFIGTRAEALATLRLYADVTCAVVVPGSRAHIAMGEVPHVAAKEREVAIGAVRLAAARVDLVLSAGFPFILPPSVLASGPLFLNSHPGLLPARQGNAAIRTAFAEGDEWQGVTVHRMTESVDAGPIIHQERVRVVGLALWQVYELLFGVVEPFVIAKALSAHAIVRANFVAT